MDPAKKIVDELHQKIDKSTHHLKEHLAGIRTGRASPSLIDTVRVEYYGTMTPLGQMAHISVPEARQLLVTPFDKNPQLLKEIERSVLKADLGCSPQSDGKVLRLMLPPLSGEQRTRLAAKVKDITEQARVALRNERRDAKKHADQAKKDGLLSEDACKKLNEKIDAEIKAGEAKLDDVLKHKTKEILED